jgi:competence protein ComFA
MGNNFICPRCGNSDPKYIGYLNDKPYCRFCISMRGKGAEKREPGHGAVVLKLDYSLSKDQKRLSENIVKNYQNKIDTLVNAVCGAGKTELIYGVMSDCLSRGKAVAFAVPRRDVVIELSHRIIQVFPENTLVSVYGGHTDNLKADIVVLTTHQLYRYDKYFDLIILDEIDAFPFKNNELLRKMFFRAVKGNIVMMSATPSKDVIEFFSQPKRQILELNTRFHRHPLPVPLVVTKIGVLKLPYLIKRMKEYIETNKKIFVFAPTISKCEFLAKIIKIFVKNGTFVHSKCKDRSQKIAHFKSGGYDYLVTTAVLERGVTFKDLQVIIYDADSEIYDSQTLIQIAGRVGRKIDAPEGEVIFLVNKTTDQIKDAINTINSKNRHLQDLL